MRYVSAQSRHDSGVCTCLDESGLCLSILVYLLGLIFVFSSSLAFISLLFLHALAFIFSVTRSFSLPEFSFFQSGTSPWHDLCYSAVVLRRSAWSRSSRFGRAALFCVAWICADARVIQVIPGEVLHSLNPRPSPLHSPGVQAASVLPVIGLAPRGEDGMVASVEETEYICQLHQLGPPLCGPPHRRPSLRVPRAGLARGEILFRFFNSISICKR